MTNVEYLAVKIDGKYFIINGIDLTLTGLKFRLEDNTTFVGNDYDPSYLNSKTLYQLCRRIKTQLKTQLNKYSKNVHIYTVNSDNTMSEINTTKLKWL